MKQQEEKAARIFLGYRDFVKAQTLRYAPFPGLSEDIFQEVFIEFVSKSDLWDLDNDVRPLLVLLTKRFANRAIDEKRKNSSEKLNLVIDQIKEYANSVKNREDEGSYTMKKLALKQCIDLLPRRSRALIDLYYFNSVSIENIAERMLISANAVYLAIHRIRLRLKKCIRKTITWSEGE